MYHCKLVLPVLLSQFQISVRVTEVTSVIIIVYVFGVDEYNLVNVILTFINGIILCYSHSQLKVLTQ